MGYMKRSLSLQLVVTIVGALAVLLTLVAALLVTKESDNTRKQVDADISALVALKANEISGYFIAKGQVILSVFAEPGLVKWFTQYYARGSHLAADRQYQDIIGYFKSFSDRDSDVKSVFLARPIPSSTLTLMAVLMAIQITTPTNDLGGRKRSIKPGSLLAIQRSMRTMVQFLPRLKPPFMRRMAS